MTRPANVRRVKNYSAASGVVYTYYFFEMQAARRGRHAGTEYVYVVAADRGEPFPLRIFVRKDAMRNASRRLGREFSGTEEYAVAKMRLFRGLDEAEAITPGSAELVVDDSNLESLLAELHLTE